MKSEREKQVSYINASIWNLEKCPDEPSRELTCGHIRERWGWGKLRKLSIDVYTLSCAKQTVTRNKASGGDGIPFELFQIMKDDATLKVLHSICQQI